ncbi:MAG: HlyC/CorC family transporter [Legionellales bacterium]|nr:HlyC/CorC family transporter [Legionellales bacterium]
MLGLTLLLIFLIILSAFFSCSETGMMSVNRYRLRHLARVKKHKAAQRVRLLLERPDRLLGVILIGNTFANILASAIATIIASHLFGDLGIAIATFFLTLAVLVFSEVAPKTLAALYPEKIAFIVSLPLSILLKVFYPVVWFINFMANNLLKCFGVSIKKDLTDPLSKEELRTVVYEASSKISLKHQSMLLGILDLDKATVEDIMVPHNEIVGIDLELTWDEILDTLLFSQHTRLPIYRNDINNIEGMIHARKLLSLMSHHKLTKETLIENKSDVYFIPENTPLTTQLVNFQREQRRTGLVVDEYGDVLGLVTIEDILEEIVGEFTSDFARTLKEVYQEEDGSYLVDGSISVRKLNRLMNWKLPIKGPKTLSGLIIEYLEFIPRSSMCLKLRNYPIEVVQVKENTIKTARIKISK